ncbi:MAG: S6e family ribosomal protein [Nitrososphaera sp.]
MNFPIFSLAQFKITISDKKGKTITQELKDKTAQPLLGVKVGSVIDSSIIGVGDGKLKITGGSDKSGTPMRADVHGGVKKYVLLSTGVGNRNEDRIRKLVRGNMVTEEIYQLNSMLIEGVLPEKREDTEGSEVETDSANKKQ